MKALTFKKSALAAAVMAVAGTANATGTLVVGSVSNTTEQQVVIADPSTTTNFQSAYHVVAADGLFTAAVTSITDTSNVVIAVRSANAALEDGDKITFTFTNGGLNAGKTYKLMTPNDDGSDVAVVDISTTVDSATTSASTHSSITFTIDDAATASADLNDWVYLVQEGATDNGDVTGTTNVGFNTVDTFGIELNVAEDTAAKSAVTVSASIDYVDGNDTDLSTETETLARVYQSATMTKHNAVTGEIDFVDSALEFTVGESLTAEDFDITNLANAGTLNEEADNVDWNNDGSISGSAYALNDGITPASNPVADTLGATPTAEITITATHCDAVEELTIGGSEITKSEDADCTWESTITDDQDVVVTVDGETVLTENTFTAAYELTQSSEVIDSSSKAIFTWDDDVQATSGISFPFLVAVNDSLSNFSVVKIDNSAVTGDLHIVISGTVEQIAFVDGVRTSEFITFENYKLNTTIPAGEMVTLLGDDIIDSLMGTDGFGDADLGYATAAPEGLVKDAAHHISVSLEESDAESASGASFGKVEAYIAAPTGRSQITVNGQN